MQVSRSENKTIENGGKTIVFNCFQLFPTVSQPQFFYIELTLRKEICRVPFYKKRISKASRLMRFLIHAGWG